MVSSAPIGLHDQQQVVEHIHWNQAFLTYEQLSVFLEHLAAKYPDHVKLTKRRLPSGQFIFHCVIGNEDLEEHDGVVIDPHSEEFGGITTASNWATYTLRQIISGEKRCLHIFGTSPDQALLQTDVIRYMNQPLGRRPQGGVVLPLLSIRHPDPRQTTEWAGGDDGHPATTPGRQFVDEQLYRLHAQGRRIRVWAAFHGLIAGNSYAMLDGDKRLARRVAPQLEAGVNCFPELVGGERNGLTLSGRLVDPGLGEIKPWPGCKATFPQLVSRRNMENWVDNLDIGLGTCELVWDLFPGALTFTPEVVQTKAGFVFPPQNMPTFLEIQARLRTNYANFVEPFVDDIIAQAAFLPDEDVLVQMARAMRSGPARWGSSKKSKSGVSEAVLPDFDGWPMDQAFFVESLFGPHYFLTKSLSPAVAMFQKYDRHLGVPGRKLANEVAHQHAGLAMMGGYAIYDVVEAAEYSRFQMLTCETLVQLASGREMAPELLAAHGERQERALAF